MINEFIPLNEGLRPVQLEGARHRRGTNQPGSMALVQQVRTHRSNHAQCRLYSLVILIDQSTILVIWVSSVLNKNWA